MSFQFWKGWPKGNRILFLVLLVVFAATIANMWVAYYLTPAPTIELRTFSEAEIDEIAVDQFSKGPFDFSVQANNYVILQRQLGTMLTTSETVAYVYLFTVALFVIGMLAVISTLSRFYYLVGMGIFILFVTTLSPELLGILGNYGKIFTIVIMACYGLASFWLFYFGVTVSFTKRILVFTAITAFLWVIINFLGVTEKPFLFLATYSVEAGLIACVLFIVTVAHEIVAGFVFAVTQSTRTQKSINHFLIITVIYVINLALAYSVRFGFIRMNVITIDLFLLLTISGVLGIWGIRQRHRIYEGVIDSDPYGVFAFMLMGALTFATIAMFMFNANDSALSALSDIIIFTHIGFGAIFLMYVISNFGGMLSKNMQVYKVLYQPNNMPFFTFRLAGLILSIVLLVYNAWQVPAYNAVAGYKIGIADLYLKLNNLPFAKAFYDESRTYSFRNHHASYALANIEGSLFNSTAERKFYADASGNRPTQASYLNLAQTYQTTDDNLEAMLALREGIRRMKNNDALENTLGLLYARAGLPDSALKYLDLSRNSSALDEIATLNITGLAAMERIGVPDDSAKELSKQPVLMANQLALANTLKRHVTTPFQLPTDTVLTMAQAAAISNYLINTRYNDDTTFVRKVVELARMPSNDGFKEALLLASAISFYSSGEVKDAFTTLEEVTVGSQHQGRYNNILTMWALENDEPQRAVGYANYAVSQNYAPARLTYAVALTEALKLDEAKVEWDSLLRNDSTNIILASRLSHAIEVSPSLAVLSLNNEERYAYIKYRLAISDSNLVFSLVGMENDDNVKAKIYLDHALKCYAADQPAAALSSLKKIVGLELTNASIGKQMQILEMLCRVQLGQSKIVLDALKQNPIAFAGKEKKYKVYFDALAAEAAGDTTTASKHFRWLGNENPFFDDGAIAAARYFRGKENISYNIIAEALAYHPSSMRIQKAYVIESANSGLENYARTQLAELKSKISNSDYAELSRQMEELLAIER